MLVHEARLLPGNAHTLPHVRVNGSITFDIPRPPHRLEHGVEVANCRREGFQGHQAWATRKGDRARLVRRTNSLNEEA